MTQFPVGLSPKQFWEKYLADGAEFWIGRFYEYRGEQKIQDGEWLEALAPGESMYDPQAVEADKTQVSKIRKTFVEIQIKDNPFVKCTPTHKIYHLVHFSDHLLRIRTRSKASDVPYCDTFFVDEDMLIVMPENCSQSSMIRVSVGIVWLKSTMMKKIINTNAQKEALAAWTAYTDWVKSNGHIFKEKKKESKLNHGIEKASEKNAQ